MIYFSNFMVLYKYRDKQRRSKMNLVNIIQNFNSCKSRSEIFEKFNCHQKNEYFYFNILEFQIKFNRKNEIISIYNDLKKCYLHIDHKKRMGVNNETN